jgi:hypothetical protein
MRNPFSVSLSVVLLHDTINGMEIHPLLRSPETFRLTHQLFINNRAEVAQCRERRKLRTDQTGIKKGAYDEKQRAKS